ncbi:MAG: DNA mismatch repair protein MutS [Chloroflexi bacterium]|nr:DNA mismatch repair protein MutS [Chloroflexota bacterium]
MSITPLRQQYLRIKRQFPDVLLLFRLGDFYETFDDDARVAASALSIALTGREMGKGQRVPMAGIPAHALDNYLGRLLAKGHKVAICEQTTDPEESKGLVEREVVRVVTPGTVVEPNLLEQKANNYLVSVVVEGGLAGVAYVDITTSEFAVTQLPLEQLATELERLTPAELLLPKGTTIPELKIEVTRTAREAQDFYLEDATERLLRHFGVTTLEAYGCADLPLAARAAGGILAYLTEMQKTSLAQVTALSTYSASAYMALDPQTRRNLELTQGGRWGAAQHSLLSVLDLTKTAMGGRLLRRWLSQPLLDRRAIEERLDVAQWLVEHATPRAKAIATVGRISDLERLVNRARAGIATPREAVALRRGLELLPELREVFGQEPPTAVEGLRARLRPCQEAVDLVKAAIVEEPPAMVADGDVIKPGFNEELDHLREASRNAKSYLANLERQEREKTGIKSLKVGYNRVFGYYIEVSNANRGQVPESYVRKQTLVGGERYITPELKEYESLILNAQERMLEIESALFKQVLRQLAGYGDAILGTAAAVAETDVFAAFAETAARGNYTRPVLTEGDELRIVNGRHPIVERSIPLGEFVPNDTELSGKESQVVILTGPNMGGKSTYLRQVGLIVLLAQMGSFVPADSVRMGIADRVFTRVGLQDDLATGQSTFMVEMVETAHILNNATPRSLIILDEIGRGTSTYDGLSIARAVAEFIHNHPRLGAKTLFATHYHELTELAQVLPRVKNYHVAVSEEGGKVAFLHKIVPGAADRSYGVHVAQLAGMPKPVIARAQEVLTTLESEKAGRPRRMRAEAPQVQVQMRLFAQQSKTLEELRRLDVSGMTPLEAITKLYELQERAKAGGGA